MNEPMLLLELDPTHVCNVAPDDAHWSLGQQWKHPGDETIYNSNSPGVTSAARLEYGWRLQQCDDEDD